MHGQILDLSIIKDKRNQMNITMQQMAEHLSFKNASTYYKYESGVYAFKANHLPKLAMVFNCDMKDLFTVEA